MRVLTAETKEDNWERLLPLAELYINSAPFVGSEHSPFSLNYGFHPSVLGENTEIVRPSGVRSEDADTYVDRMNAVWDTFRRNLVEGQVKTKTRVDATRRDERMGVGDFVLIDIGEGIGLPEAVCRTGGSGLARVRGRGFVTRTSPSSHG